MNVNELIAQLKSEIEADNTTVERILDEGERNGLKYMSKADSDTCARALDNMKRNNRKLDAAIAAKKTEDATDERLRNATVPTGLPNRSRNTASVSVGSDARTYHPGIDADRGLSNSPGGAFLLDVGSAFLGDPLAQERLQRHQHEMRVDGMLQERSVGTGAFSGLVVPAYAVEDAAPAVAAARPLLDVMAPRTLPDSGMSVNISRITTPTAAGMQASENTTVTGQDMDDTLLTLVVQTAAGQQTISRQAIERGTLVEDLVTQDLLIRVAVAMETQAIAQATVGLAAIATGQTYTNATLDTTAVPAFLKQLPAAQNSLDTALLARSRPGVAVMAPRRYNWLTAAVSSNWPTLSGGQVPVQAGGVVLTDNPVGVRAKLPNGMRIVADPNVTTVANGTALTGGSQDHVYVISGEESFLYEMPNKVMMIRAEQPAAASLGVLFVAYSYYAFTFGRYPAANLLINGTGLGTPSFV